MAIAARALHDFFRRTGLVAFLVPLVVFLAAPVAFLLALLVAFLAVEAVFLKRPKFSAVPIRGAALG